MDKSICGIDCGQCPLNGSCGGCKKTDGRPFGGECMTASCSRNNPNGCEGCSGACAMKKKLIEEFNALNIPDMPKVTDLCALAGSFINIKYRLPGGQSMKFWDDSRIYLGYQLEKGEGRHYGLTADENYLMVSEYGENGADAQIVVFKKRG